MVSKTRCINSASSMEGCTMHYSGAARLLCLKILELISGSKRIMGGKLKNNR